MTNLYLVKNYSNVNFVTNPTRQKILWRLISVPTIGRNKSLCKSVEVFDYHPADIFFSNFFLNFSIPFLFWLSYYFSRVSLIFLIFWMAGTNVIFVAIHTKPKVLCKTISVATMANSNVNSVMNHTLQNCIWIFISIPNIHRNKILSKSVVVFDHDFADLPFPIWIFMSLSILILLISIPIVLISIPIVLISIPIALFSTYSILLIRSRSFNGFSDIFSQAPNYSRKLCVNGSPSQTTFRAATANLNLARSNILPQIFWPIVPYKSVLKPKILARAKPCLPWWPWCWQVFGFFDPLRWHFWTTYPISTLFVNAPMKKTD